jgi:hypothetical protein
MTGVRKAFVLDTLVAILTSRKGGRLTAQIPKPSGPARLISVEAGRFRLAIPLDQVQRIVGALPPVLDQARGDEVDDSIPTLNLAEVFSTPPQSKENGSLVLQGPRGPLLARVCRLNQILEVAESALRPLPDTVVTRWPGLVRGVVRHNPPHVLLDGHVLGALLQSWLDERSSAGAK